MRTLGWGLFGASAAMTTATLAVSVRTSADSTDVPIKTTVAATSEPSSASTVMAGVNDDLVDAIGVVMSMTMDGTILPEPDPACFDRAAAAFDEDAMQAAGQLAEDPLAWSSIDREARLPVVAAYVGCAEIDAVAAFLAIGAINALDAMQCIADAWSGLLSADMIASSLAFGTGLDDLPPDVVAQLVDGAVPCVPDEGWWIDDVAVELERQYSFTAEQATCVATKFVGALGIGRAIERPVLTIQMLTLPDDDLDAIDLDGCGVTVTLRPMTAGDVGGCLAGLFREPEPREVPCDTGHNAEILAAIDLSDDAPEWPGINAIDERAGELCIDAVNQAAPGRDDIGVVWFVATRQVWERDGRIVNCVIGPLDGSDWMEPSGLLPESSATTLVDTAPR